MKHDRFSSFARVVIAMEKYVLPWWFLWFAYRLLAPISRLYESRPAGLARLSPELVQNGLICFVQVAAGIALLLSRPVTRLPSAWRELIVPILGTFYYLSYNFVHLFPPQFQRNVVPVRYQIPLATAGLAVSCVGFVIAGWGVLSLGRSFGVLAVVRKVVGQGPYRHVRHPIYAGYMLHMCGLLLSRVTVVMAVLVAGHMIITIWRARIEEAMLGAYSPDYSRYARKTGFLLPRFCR
jgi:protein-S-isoprenylcysteine O-methyltransferase Ste14